MAETVDDGDSLKKADEFEPKEEKLGSIQMNSGFEFAPKDDPQDENLGIHFYINECSRNLFKQKYSSSAPNLRIEKMSRLRTLHFVLSYLNYQILRLTGFNEFIASFQFQSVDFQISKKQKSIII